MRRILEVAESVMRGNSNKFFFFEVDIAWTVRIPIIIRYSNGDGGGGRGGGGDGGGRNVAILELRLEIYWVALIFCWKTEKKRK